MKSKLIRGFVYFVSIAALLGLGGCASFYVDATTKEIASSQFAKAAQNRPVQVVFEFQTKGVANERATAYLKPKILEQIKASALFADVAEAPVAGGALLSVTLNNVPLTDDAFSKGFVTGLTFGLAGSQVSDGYVCTASYLPPDSDKAINKQARHAIHTTMGTAAAPGNAVKAASIDEAVLLMTRQVVSNVLNDVSHDAAFR